MSIKRSSVYCPACRGTKYIDLRRSELPTEGSLIKRSLNHGNHILLMDIDANATIRNETVVEVLRNPIHGLLEDVSQRFYLLNEEPGVQCIHIDVYTKNPTLVMFFQSIISNVFDHAIGLDSQKRIDMRVESMGDKTFLFSEKFHLMVGPYIKEGLEEADETHTGLVLDIEEAERMHLDLEQTFVEYDWVALLVPRNKREGYIHAFSSLLDALGKPFFIEALSNSTLKQLFDFIEAMTTFSQAELP